MVSNGKTTINAKIASIYCMQRIFMGGHNIPSCIAECQADSDALVCAVVRSLTGPEGTTRVGFIIS